MSSLWHWLLKIGKGLASPPGITALCLLAFCSSLTWFYYTAAYVKMDWIEFLQFKDRWRNTILGIGTLNVFIIDWMGVKSEMQLQFLNVYKCVLILTYLIIMMVYFQFTTQPYFFLLILDTVVTAVTLMILISSIRHEALE